MDPQCCTRGLPFLGICLGGQLLARALGAVVARGRPEAGLHDVFLTDAADHDPLFAGLPRRLQVFGWHEDSVDLARGAVPLAGSIECTYQAFGSALRSTDSSSIPRLAPSTSLAGAKSPATRGLAERTGSDFDALLIELRRATPRLGALAGQLLQRWLHLVASRREAAA